MIRGRDSVRSSWCGPVAVLVLLVSGCTQESPPPEPPSPDARPQEQRGPSTAAFQVEAEPVSGPGYAPVSRDRLADLYANSWFEGRSGQGFLHLSPGHYLVEDSGSDRWKVTHHLSAYDRESHVPLWIYDPADPTHETRTEPVTLESIGATIFDVLGLDVPPWVTAPSLTRGTLRSRRAVVVLVLDALPQRQLEAQVASLPNFSQVRAKSKVYTEAWLGYMSSATTVSHAVIGTGAPPRATGVPLNHDPVAPGKKREVFRDGDLSRLVIPTVADLHDARDGGKAQVISFSSQSRAAVTMAGHGAGFEGGDRDIVVWQQNHTGRLETWPELYELPESVRDYGPEAFMSKRGLEGEAWTPDRLFYSPTTALYCEEVVERLLDAADFGSDETCDLLYFNQKVLDSVGHLAGPESRFYREGLEALDGFLGRFVAGMHERAGDSFLLIVTSDHGFGPARNPDHPDLHRRAELQDRINAAFPSPEGDIIRNIRDLNLFFDMEALAAGGHDVETVCRWVETEVPWVEDALPLSEVLASRVLPR